MAIERPWSNTLSRAIAVCLLAALIPYVGGLLRTKSKENAEISYPKFNATGQSRHPSFHGSVNSYWSLNAREVKPACIVRPASVYEVASAVKLLKSEFDATATSARPLQFAVRSGGHSPEAGFASVNRGIVVDMSLINEVAVSEDKQSVVIGAGARWSDVSSKLDSMGLAVVGGRNSNVGVGGLVLGGGISFFSPRYGMVCDNIDEYEIVLADGNITRVTSSQHEDLWRALKGGTGNFGIVTRITAKTFPTTKIWAGYAYWGGWQTPKVLRAFADFNKPEHFDEYAAGPILALSYVQKVGIRITVCSFAYTKPEKWPRVFKDFQSIWRLWGTTKVQSLTDATHELSTMAPSGQRQFQVTTTIQNDLDTFNAFSDIFNQKLEEVKAVKAVKAGIWSLVLQPLSTAVTHKGSPNALGLETRHSNNTLVIVLISVSWRDAVDDELVHRVSRDIIAMGDAMAHTKGTADPYRYLNYAASGQNPIDGYGLANKQFLQTMSQKYDPHGLFQRAKQGGFKLDLF